MAGLVAYQGRVVGEAKRGPAIIPVGLWERVQARLSDPARRTSPGRPAGTALSGIAVCGKCGGPMNASNKHGKGGVIAPVYLCSRFQHLSRRRPLVDEPVLSTVGDWLVENREAIAAHAMPVTSGPQMAAVHEVAALTERLDVLASQVAAGELDPTDYAAATRHIRGRLADAQRRAAVIAGRPATIRLLSAADVGAEWDRLCSADDVEPLRAVLREVLDRVVVRAATAARPTLDDIEIAWARWATRANAF
jgi:site-specific DNA recombinase